MIKVLVTGKDSQLARCINDLELSYPLIIFVHKNSKELDITNYKLVEKHFQDNIYNYCINCAAYTNVDKAESEPEIAKRVNTAAVENLAINCDKHNVVLIHVSTDFVFDGESKKPYLEIDTTNPLGVYGLTKRDGEIKVAENCSRYFIIRTSWLYSKYGKNFVKTMLDLSNNKTEINVVSDQLGSPTWAMDLAIAICQIIKSTSNNFGIYHYCNLGKITWFDLAKQIFDLSSTEVNLKPIPTKDFPTKAQRPKYSVLDTSKIQTELNLDLLDWKVSLERFIKHQGI